jgi:hypothetical protein
MVRIPERTSLDTVPRVTPIRRRCAGIGDEPKGVVDSRIRHTALDLVQ